MDRLSREVDIRTNRDVMVEDVNLFDAMRIVLRKPDG